MLQVKVQVQVVKKTKKSKEQGFSCFGVEVNRVKVSIIPHQ